MVQGLNNLTLGGSSYSVYVDTTLGAPWALLLGGPGNDTNWDYASSNWLSTSPISEASLYGGGAGISAGAKHSMFYSLSTFSAIRVSVSVSSPAQGQSAGTQDFFFNFTGFASIANLMFTTANELLSGPTFSDWVTGFGLQSNGSPYFQRMGNCTNPIVARLLLPSSRVHLAALTGLCLIPNPPAAWFAIILVTFRATAALLARPPSQAPAVPPYAEAASPTSCAATDVLPPGIQFSPSAPFVSSRVPIV